MTGLTCSQRGVIWRLQWGARCQWKCKIAKCWTTQRHQERLNLTSPGFNTIVAFLFNHFFCICEQCNTLAKTEGSGEMMCIQVLSPRSYRLIVTIILQGHPCLLGWVSEIILGVDPRECGYAKQPTSVCLHTNCEQIDLPAAGQPSHYVIFFNL